MNDMKKLLQEKTNRSETECIVINDILNSHFIIGKNNKEKICEDFKEKLNLTEEQADELYNECMEIIVKGIFRQN